MKGLILAAGKGSRLNPITNDRPKAMVEINGIPLIIRTIECLIANNIQQIGIVLGYMGGYIRDYIGSTWKNASITYIENPEYETTNNMVSFYAAKEYMDEDIVLCECDVIVDEDTMKKVVSSAGECTILVSPFNPQTMDGTVIEVNDNKAVSLILGKWQNKNTDYSMMKKTVNIYRFEKNFLQYKLLPQIRTFLTAYDKNNYYEVALGSLIYYRMSDIRVVEISEDKWFEIDNVEDLNRATKILKGERQ